MSHRYQVGQLVYRDGRLYGRIACVDGRRLSVRRLLPGTEGLRLVVIGPAQIAGDPDCQRPTYTVEKKEEGTEMAPRNARSTRTAADGPGQRIAEARKKAGISQAEAAYRVEVATNTWARWERDELLPSLTALHRIAEALGCRLDVELVPEATAKTPRRRG